MLLEKRHMQTMASSQVARVFASVTMGWKPLVLRVSMSSSNRGICCLAWLAVTFFVLMR